MECTKPNCLIFNQNQVLDCFLLYDIQELFTVITCKDINNVKIQLRKDSIEFIIIIIDKNLNEIIPIVKYIKDSFQLIPIIALINENNNLELARECGNVGFDNVISIDNKDVIINTLKKRKSLNLSSIKLSELNITIEKYPQIIQKALIYIQQKYVDITNVCEISDYLDISESYFSHLFNKENLPSPKKTLMYCKVEHAIKLMQNEGLKLNEIASMSGFTNIYRFNDCFKRIYKKSPSEFRGELCVKF